MLAVIATAQILAPVKKWIGPNLESSPMSGKPVAFPFILMIHFRSGDEPLTKHIIAFELLTIAIGAILINIGSKVSFRLTPNLIKSTMLGTLGISWCRLESTV